MNTLPLEVICYIFSFCDKNALISCTTVDKVINVCVDKIDIALHIVNTMMNTVMYHDEGKKYPQDMTIPYGTLCNYITLKGTTCTRYAKVRCININNNEILLCNAHRCNNKIKTEDRLFWVLKEISLISNIDEVLLKKRYIPRYINTKDINIMDVYSLCHVKPPSLISLKPRKLVF